MIEGIPKVSVLVITYKQQDIIGRTLDSLLVQKDYLYEVCVSDDCSPDNTWQVLLEYQKKYPDLIKLHRNNPNVGIFENTEYTWTMPSGDIINQIAGDDITPNGWYKTVVEFILQHNIDYKNELFCIYCNSKNLYPNGDYFVSHCSAITKYPDQALRLALRGVINSRGCCFSIRVLKMFDKVSQGRSHIAETAQDRQLQIFVKNNYYIPYIGNVYYTGIGVSTRIENEEIFQERLQIWPYAEKFFASKGVELCQKDKNYGKFNMAMKQFRHCKTFGHFVNLVWCFIISRDLSLPKGDGFRHFVFAIRRRIPHNKPIEAN